MIHDRAAFRIACRIDSVLEVLLVVFMVSNRDLNLHSRWYTNVREHMKLTILLIPYDLIYYTMYTVPNEYVSFERNAEKESKLFAR
jgi:hypothetical protein